MIRTDLALEFAPKGGKNKKQAKITRSCVVVDEALSEKLGKAVGNYITLECRAVADGTNEDLAELTSELAKNIKTMTAGKTNIMVVGLGNPHLTADSLGVLVADKLLVSRHIASEGETKLCVITPNVLGVTGIESFDVVAGVASRVKPQIIIAIDSLASAAVNRIAAAFQLSSAGITPGSGVSNHRARLDESALGVPVIALGVPLVVYASTIICDAIGSACPNCDEAILDMVVTPKDIDILVEECACVLADAINDAFF